MIFSRVWAMPSADTFNVKPIGDFVSRYLGASRVSVDPFARNFEGPTFTNDLNPNTKAKYHMDAIQFLDLLWLEEVKADLVLFDPPYSPRQVAECYKILGRKVTQKDTQNSVMIKALREGLNAITDPGAIALSFAWNSTGMAKGWETIETLLVCHGGVHNDTICVAQRKI